jgi:hypothetical protein
MQFYLRNGINECIHVKRRCFRIILCLQADRHVVVVDVVDVVEDDENENDNSMLINVLESSCSARIRPTLMSSKCHKR